MTNVSLASYANKAMSMLDECQIEYDRKATYHFETTKQDYWGLCCKNGNSFNIKVNDRVLRSNDVESVILNVLLHEYLHTVRGCFNHGKLWKHYANLIRTRFGIDIKRIASSEEYGVEIDYTEYKYKLVCNHCGETSYYKRACTSISNPNGVLACNKCLHSDFTVYNMDGTIYIPANIQKMYVLTCIKCGHEYKYTRMCKAIRNYELYRCNCGGKLTLSK